MARYEDLSEEIAHAARSMHGNGDAGMTAQSAADLAVKLLNGCDAATVTRVQRGRLLTVAHTDDFACAADTLQYELGEGPCLDALQRSGEVASTVLAHDQRWPRWGPRVAAQHGFRSMLAFRLYTAQDTVGALNLYAYTEEAFSDEDYREGHALAAQAAVALAAAERVEHLQVAVERRTIIGQAQGILMERYGLRAPQAFALLARLSQHRNEKLYAVAEQVAATRALPADPTPGPPRGREQ